MLRDNSAATPAASQALRRTRYVRHGGVAVLCLDRPERRNAIDVRMAQETLAVARAIAGDATVRAVLICGNGPAFTVGADINVLARAVPGGLGEQLTRMTTPLHEALLIFSRLDAPVVTAVHGPVVGGGLGYVCVGDIVLAAENATFLAGYAAVGLTGDSGSSWYLPRLVGPRRAARMYLENRPVTATEAVEWGLATESVPPAELRMRALDLTTRLAEGPTQAFGRMRRLLQDSWHADLSEQLRAEIRCLAATGDSMDAANAIEGFVVKHRPEFQGR